LEFPYLVVLSSCVEFVAIESPSSFNVSPLEQLLGIKSRAVGKTKGCYKSQEINKNKGEDQIRAYQG
jgi:hypothetical protein